MFYCYRNKTCQVLFICLLLAAAEKIPAQSPETYAVNQERKIPAKKNFRLLNDRNERASNQRTLKKIQSEILTSPEDATLYNNLGVSHARLQNYDQAITALEKAIALKPNIPSTYYNLSAVYDRLNRYDEAIVYAQKAVELNGSDANFRQQLCQLYLSTENYPAAVKSYEVLLKMIPPNSMIRLEYVVVLLRSNQFDKALTTAKENAGLFPKEPLIQNSLGMALFHKKKYKNSVKAFLRAIELKTDFNEAVYNLALSQMMLNDRDAAIKQYDLLKKSNSVYAERLYKLLYSRNVVYVDR